MSSLQERANRNEEIISVDIPSKYCRCKKIINEENMGHEDELIMIKCKSYNAKLLCPGKRWYHI